MPAKKKSATRGKPQKDPAQPVAVKPVAMPPSPPPEPSPPSPPVRPTPPPPPSAVDLEESVDVDEILDSDPEGSYLDRANTAIFAGGVILAAGIIVLSLIVYGMYVRAPKVAQQQKTTTVEVLPTPTPSFNPGSITFEVFNASGVAGAAGKAALDLEARGYHVATIGNMKNKTASEVYVVASMALSDRTMLLSDMTSLFGVSSSSGDLTNSTATAKLVIGAKGK